MQSPQHHLAGMALELLGRATLTGKEVAAFVAVDNWLRSMLDTEENAVDDAVKAPEIVSLPQQAAE